MGKNLYIKLLFMCTLFGAVQAIANNGGDASYNQASNIGNQMKHERMSEEDAE